MHLGGRADPGVRGVRFDAGGTCGRQQHARLQRNTRVDRQDACRMKPEDLVHPGAETRRASGGAAASQSRNSIGDLGHRNDAQVAMVAVPPQPIGDVAVRAGFVRVQIRQDIGVEQVRRRSESTEPVTTDGGGDAPWGAVIAGQRAVGQPVAEGLPATDPAVPLFLRHHDHRLLAVAGDALWT